MEKIDSFKVDHRKMDRGVYISRIDKVDEHVIVTYDIRIYKPNTTYMKPDAAHTLEHIIATLLRNGSHKDNIIYFGPMGCLTGFYVVVLDMEDDVVLSMLRYVFDIASRWGNGFYTLGHNPSIPGCSETECGNYELHDLLGAKIIASDYINVLNNTKSIINYPYE